jgi:hypothetical protein
LVRWLRKEFPATPIVQYNVSYTNTYGVNIALQGTKPPLLSNPIILLIVIIDPPARTDAERNLILAKVVTKSIGDILNNSLGSEIILFATAHPNAGVWDVISEIERKQLIANMLIWRSPGPQPAERLAEVVDSLKKNLVTKTEPVVHDISLKLQLLGFLPVWGYSEALQR